MGNKHTHTVIALYIGIITIRLVTSGRLQNAWEALRSEKSSAPLPSRTKFPTHPTETTKPSEKVG